MMNELLNGVSESVKTERRTSCITSWCRWSLAGGGSAVVRSLSSGACLRWTDRGGIVCAGPIQGISCWWNGCRWNTLVGSWEWSPWGTVVGQGTDIVDSALFGFRPSAAMAWYYGSINIQWKYAVEEYPNLSKSPIWRRVSSLPVQGQRFLIFPLIH